MVQCMLKSEEQKIELVTQAKKNALTREALQAHCDQIIVQLEKAVQAAVYAKHFTSDNTRDIQTAVEAAKQTKVNYFQTVKDLYGTKEMPRIYSRVYDLAISESTETRRHYNNGYSQSTEAYKIKAGWIIRRLNHDFLPHQSRDLWISYNQAHLNCVGNITNACVGTPNYKINWQNDGQDALEDKTLYLTIEKDGLLYRVLDPDNKPQAGKISLEEILATSLQSKHFNGSENALVYAEIQIDTHCIQLKNTHVFSEISDNNQQSIALQEQCTLIIDRLIDAVYAEMFRKYLPAHIAAIERDAAQNEAKKRYAFYMRTVETLYGSASIPLKFEDIYKDAIQRASFNIRGELLRHPIRIGAILSQLNHDFVLKNNQSGKIRWLVYNKPYLNFHGNTINKPIGAGLYQLTQSEKRVDGLNYQVLCPNGDISTGKLSLDKILTLVKFGHIERPDEEIFVEITRRQESPATYCYAIIMPILSHNIAQIVAVGLLAIGTTLAISGIAVGIGTGMAIVGSSVLIAGFFPPKKYQTLTPGFFKSSPRDESCQLIENTGLVY